MIFTTCLKLNVSSISRRIFTLPMVLLFMLFFCAQGADADDARKTWSLEPIVDAGLVYESTDDMSTYTGEGISGRWAPGAWAVTACYRSDEYTINYYGVTKKVIAELFLNNALSDSYYTIVGVHERKEEQELLLGRQVWGEQLYLFAGMRRLRLLNNFSTMSIYGPAVRLESDFDWGTRNIIMTLGGVLDRSGKVVNHDDEYIIFDGEKTISDFGELQNAVNWSAMIGLQPWRWSRLWFGYEGSLLSFKYVYRSSHGVIVKMEF